VDHEAARDLLARLHAAQGAFYAGGDSAPVRELLTGDVVWRIPGHSPIAGEYRGVDAVVEYFTRRRELADRTFRMHPLDVLLGGGDHVAALTDGTALIDGVERHWSTVGLYRVEGGLIAACWLLPLDAVAFDEIWTPR
jgi:ketosteroid isomerase-like protein